jgi:hypothetical protein
MDPFESTAMTALFERRLRERVEATVQRVGWCHALRHELQQLLYDERLQAKQKLGLDVPRLVPVMLPSEKWVYCFPAEMDERGVNVQVLNICANHPRISMVEVARAMAQAYPWLRGKDRIDLFKAQERQKQVLTDVSQH